MNCLDCDKTFKKKQQYLFHFKTWKHIKIITYRNKKYSCNKCNFNGCNVNSFKKHYFNHLIFKYKCISCNFYTDNKKYYSRHIGSIKHIRIMDEEDLTDNQFDRLVEFEDNKLKHPFIDPEDLYVEYKCDSCNFITPLKTCYTRHMNTIKHIRNNNGHCYKCIKCKYKTFSIKNYNKHLECKTHIIKVNQLNRNNFKGYCSFCNCSYSNENNHLNTTKHIVKQLNLDVNYYNFDRMTIRNNLFTN